MKARIQLKINIKLEQSEQFEKEKLSLLKRRLKKDMITNIKNQMQTFNIEIEEFKP